MSQAVQDADTAGRPAGQLGIPPLVGVIWALLVVNTLGSQGVKMILPIPRSVVQMVTMGSVLVAFALALLLNPRLQVRPSAYLFLLTLLLIVSVAASADLESGYGSLFRCSRLTVFIATLWLLTRWWDGTVTFVRYHVRALGAALVTVAIGLIVAPGLARPSTLDGRLVGTVWPLTPPQVAQYSAVVAGLTIILWMGRQTSARSVAIFAAPAIVLLMLTHTRTATFGLLAGLGMGALSLALTSGRARRVFAGGAVFAGFATVAFGPAVQAWVQRGDAESFSNFTGRAKVWDALLATPRTPGEQLIGVGLTDKSFNGLPIDSSWLAVYYEQGYAGMAIVVMFMLTLVLVVALRPPSAARACAVFLVAYCLAASFTEAGLGDASPYLLNLAAAAALVSPALLAAPMTDRLPPEVVTEGAHATNKQAGTPSS